MASSSSVQGSRSKEGHNSALSQAAVTELQYINTRLFQSKEEMLKLQVSRDIIIESIRHLQGHIVAMENRAKDLTTQQG